MFLIFRRTEIIDKGLVPCPHLASIHYHLFCSVGEEKPPQTSEKEGAKQPNLRPHSTVESGLAIQNIIPLSESNLIIHAFIESCTLSVQSLMPDMSLVCPL